MNDLDQLLRAAAGSGDGDRLDPHDLLASGRRTVRRRRIAVAGGVTAVVVAAAAVVAWLPAGEDKPDVVDDPKGPSSTYEEVMISPAEVERRCSIVLNKVNRTGDVRYVAGRADDGTAVSVPEDPDRHLLETTEGQTAYLRPVGEKWPDGEPSYGSGAGYLPPSSGFGDGDTRLIGETACVIPQADEVDAIPASLDTPLPEDASTTEIVDLCSAQVGYDLRGWDPLAAGELGDSSVAMVMSDNGYVATCTVYDGGWFSDLEIDPEPYLDDGGDPLPARAGDLAVGISYGSGPFTEARVLRGLPDGYTVSFVADGEVLAETTTHRGAYLIGFRAPDRSRVTGRVTDPDGAVVWEGPVSH